jgi:CubicO group peptidase (beta-lactamase class C family)
MTRLPATFALLGSLLASFPAVGQQTATADATNRTGIPAAPSREVIEAIVERVRKEHNIPSLAAAYITADGSVIAGASGLRRVGGDERVTVTDKYHLGSCTKAMTATLIARLVEQGVLTWETTVGEVFAGMTMDDGWKSVTITHLVTNTGGAPADLDRDGLWAALWKHEGTPVEAREALVAGVIKHAPQSPAGKQFVYSNAGFAIAGAMTERKTGKAWEDLMRELLFVPLGMSSAGFGAPGEPKVFDQPRGHRGDEPVEPGRGADNPVAIGPAGIVHASIEDWGKFIAMHLDEGTREGALLTPASFKFLHTAGPAKGSSYACGWGVTQRDWAGPTKRVLTHAGSNTMWYCVAWLAPDADFAVIVASNSAGEQTHRACDKVAELLIETRAAP